MGYESTAYDANPTRDTGIVNYADLSAPFTADMPTFDWVVSLEV